MGIWVNPFTFLILKWTGHITRAPQVNNVIVKMNLISFGLLG